MAFFHRRLLLVVLVNVCYLIPIATAHSSTQNYSFPLTPRITGTGLFGNNEMLAVDAMAAVWGNQDHILYLDIQGKTVFQNDWFGGVGAGVRTINNDERILGAYVFADRSVSPNHNYFWFISPGIESFDNEFDFRANGYFPLNTTQQYGKTDWADNFGIYDYVWFQGHQQYDRLMTQNEEVGWGVDAEIGRIIPGTHAMRMYLGGYHFNFDTASDINGISGRGELPLNQYLALTVRDSYDNVQHNTLLLGLRLTLGGINKHPRDAQQAIQKRMLDPVERNLATLGQGVGEPIQSILTSANMPLPPNPNPPVAPPVERDNIWFFSPSAQAIYDGSVNSCTAKNPCKNTDFTQATIDGINQLTTITSTQLSVDPSFYLAPGHYSALQNNNPLSLNNDAIFGRSINFIEPAQSTYLNGAIIFSGTNNLLDHIILQNSANFPQPFAIFLNSNSELVIQNSRIGVDQNNWMVHDAGSYATAIAMQNADLYIRKNSEIYAFSNDAAAFGISIVNTQNTASTINIEDSLISVKAVLNPDENLIAAAILIDSNKNLDIQLNHSQVQVLVNSNLAAGESAQLQTAGIFWNPSIAPNPETYLKIEMLDSTISTITNIALTHNLYLDIYSDAIATTENFPVNNLNLTLSDSNLASIVNIDAITEPLFFANIESNGINVNADNFLLHMQGNSALNSFVSSDVKELKMGSTISLNAVKLNLDSTMSSNILLEDDSVLDVVATINADKISNSFINSHAIFAQDDYDLNSVIIMNNNAVIHVNNIVNIVDELSYVDVKSFAVLFDTMQSELTSTLILNSKSKIMADTTVSLNTVAQLQHDLFAVTAVSQSSSHNNANATITLGPESIIKSSAAINKNSNIPTNPFQNVDTLVTGIVNGINAETAPGLLINAGAGSEISALADMNGLDLSGNSVQAYGIDNNAGNNFAMNGTASIIAHADGIGYLMEDEVRP